MSHPFFLDSGIAIWPGPIYPLVLRRVRADQVTAIGARGLNAENGRRPQQRRQNGFAEHGVVGLGKLEDRPDLKTRP